MTRLILRNTYYCKRTFQTKCYKKHECARTSSENFSSNVVRQTFLDYFVKENSHKFIRSSPVVPFCDPTVAFVNAGMNQFKSIFLGHQLSPYDRIANSQKCVRVGGKHNDLSVVGNDGYHHTFFEMLGNWSFDNYFKKEACEMAWNLLTGPYGLNPASLYVTYFGGDSKLNLQPDLECKDIWKSLGIADDRILPFGASDNFWEMGPMGPCGPCTEIHIDHSGGTNRSKDVNKGLPDLTELWNIVFIQYNRNLDGSISQLPKRHVDTGMGLERLTAILQGKKSNYDTDIFAGLFECIQKKCKSLPEYRGQFGADDPKEIDTFYRILADHSRTIIACLADGMIPEENQKLRRILRKSFLISETVFRQDKGLVNELARVVSHNLGSVYPEMERRLREVQQIISFEEEVYKSIRSTATKEWRRIIEKEPRLQHLNILEMPGLVSAYNELQSLKTGSCVSSQLAFKLYDTFGLEGYTLQTLAKVLHLKFESEDLKRELDLARMRTKQEFLSGNKFDFVIQKLQKTNVEKTENVFKYKYESKNGFYIFEDVPVKVLGIIQNGSLIQELNSKKDSYLLLNKTNLYTEAGGQSSDKGLITFPNEKFFQITDTLNINGYILHKGQLQSKTSLKTGESGSLSLDQKHRLRNMSNHTATHLINAALKAVTKGATCQKSSKVTADYLTFDVGVYSKKLGADDLKLVENLVRSVIKKSVDVKVSEINSQELLNLDNVTLVPGEVYPETGIRLVEITSGDFSSREPCCGTHVLNTADIKDFCIISFKSLGRSTNSITAVTRNSAVAARENGENILSEILKIQENVTESENELNTLDVSINEIKKKLSCRTEESCLMPFDIRAECLKILQDLSKQLRDVERDSLKQFIDLEMKSVIAANCNMTKTNKPYIVHFLGCSSILDNVPLQRATKMCPDIPVVVISYSDDLVKARCCVPEKMVSEEFNAELWLKMTVARIFKGSAAAPKGQNAHLVCNMKGKRVNKLDWDSFLDEALTAARKYADTHLK